MASTPKRVLHGFLTASAADMYTCPAEKRFIVGEIVVANTDVAQRTATIHHTNGGAAADSNMVLPVVTLKAKQVVGMGRGWILEAGDKLKGLSDLTDKVAVTIYGVEEDV